MAAVAVLGGMAPDSGRQLPILLTSGPPGDGGAWGRSEGTDLYATRCPAYAGLLLAYATCMLFSHCVLCARATFRRTVRLLHCGVRHIETTSPTSSPFPLAPLPHVGARPCHPFHCLPRALTADLGVRQCPLKAHLGKR